MLLFQTVFERFWRKFLEKGLGKVKGYKEKTPK